MNETMKPSIPMVDIVFVIVWDLNKIVGEQIYFLSMDINKLKKEIDLRYENYQSTKRMVNKLRQDMNTRQQLGVKREELIVYYIRALVP